MRDRELIICAGPAGWASAGRRRHRFAAQPGLDWRSLTLLADAGANAPSKPNELAKVMQSVLARQWNCDVQEEEASLAQSTRLYTPGV